MGLSRDGEKLIRKLCHNSLVLFHFLTDFSFQLERSSPVLWIFVNWDLCYHFLFVQMDNKNNIKIQFYQLKIKNKATFGCPATWPFWVGPYPTLVTLFFFNLVIQVRAIIIRFRSLKKKKKSLGFDFIELKTLKFQL